MHPRFILCRRIRTTVLKIGLHQNSLGNAKTCEIVRFSSAQVRDSIQRCRVTLGLLLLLLLALPCAELSCRPGVSAVLSWFRPEQVGSSGFSHHQPWLPEGSVSRSTADLVRHTDFLCLLPTLLPNVPFTALDPSSHLPSPAPV